MLHVLDEFSWRFHYTIIEKSYIAPTKFVDTIFDSFDNPAVHPLWYTTELFRHTLCIIIDDMMEEEIAKRFWQHYLNDDIDGLLSIAQIFLERSPYIFDKRCSEVIRDGLSYAIKNPEIFTLISARGKSAYKKQTPNMVAFSSLLTATHKYCKHTGLGVSQLIHDQTDEFRGTMREYHRMFFGVDYEEDKFGGIPQFKEVGYELGQFDLKSSKKSSGLQVVDLLLWLIQRDIKNDDLQETKLRILEGSDEHVISRAMSLAIIHARHYQVMQQEISPEELMSGKELNVKIKQRMAERMRK